MEYQARCHCGRVRFSFRSPGFNAVSKTTEIIRVVIAHRTNEALMQPATRHAGSDRMSQPGYGKRAGDRPHACPIGATQAGCCCAIDMQIKNPLRLSDVTTRP